MTDEALPCQEFDPSTLILQLDRTLPADPKRISPVVDEILGSLGSMECARGKEFEVETAVREALANAILHGCKEDPSGEVQVSVACDVDRGVLIVVRDPGSGFDPSTLPSPLVGQNLYSHHGRGIFLINRLMDEVRFEKGGTQIVMRLHGSPPALG